MKEIERLGSSPRWADGVIHGGVARWVEVAEDFSLYARGQIAQVLAQIDQTLPQVGSDRTRLLEVLIFLADVGDQVVLNELWDRWAPTGYLPVRACVGAVLAAGCRVEMIVHAAVKHAT